MQRKISKALVQLLRWIFGTGFLVLCFWALFLAYQRYQVQHLQSELRTIYEQEIQRKLQQEQQGIQEDRQNELSTEQAQTKKSEAHSLQSLNQDYLGWLKVYGADVDLPVVLGKDNEFYLTHNFYRETSKYGSLFADYETDTVSGNLLIYGHHMRDGSMFGSLEKFAQKDFFEEHGLISWEGKDGKEYYEIFAVLVIPGDEKAADYFPIRNYLHTQANESGSELLEILQNRAYLWKHMGLSETQKFLFLMTCDYTRTDGRLLLCAQQIKDENP